MLETFLWLFGCGNRLEWFVDWIRKETSAVDVNSLALERIPLASR